MTSIKELVLRVPEVTEATSCGSHLRKTRKTPKANKLLELEERMSKLEQDLSGIRKYLADLELLTYGHQKVNPYSFCIDDVDHKIVDYIMHYKGATTPELADYLKVNRCWC
jgi:DNA-binding protein Fis